MKEQIERAIDSILESPLFEVPHLRSIWTAIRKREATDLLKYAEGISAEKLISVLGYSIPEFNRQDEEFIRRALQ